MTPRLLIAGLARYLDLAPLDWLLSGEAFIRYRTLTDLLGRAEVEPEVVAARQSLGSDPLIRQLLDARNPDGYWGTTRDIYTWWPKVDTTFWVLNVLADFGLGRDDADLSRACEYILSTRLPDGGFGWAPPPVAADCFTGILVEALAKLGYASDPRVTRAYAWLVERQRLDGGFWCKNTALPGHPREREPSCAYATLCVLAALVQDPKHRESAASHRAAGFLLNCWENRGSIKYAGHDSQIGRGWEKLKYPYTGYHILKYLDALSRVGCAANDARMSPVVDLVFARRDAMGRFRPESVHRAWSRFDFGQKESPSRWITLLVYRTVRRLVAYHSE